MGVNDKQRQLHYKRDEQAECQYIQTDVVIAPRGELRVFYVIFGRHNGAIHRTNRGGILMELCHDQTFKCAVQAIQPVQEQPEQPERREFLLTDQEAAEETQQRLRLAGRNYSTIVLIG